MPKIYRREALPLGRMNKSSHAEYICKSFAFCNLYFRAELHALLFSAKYTIKAVVLYRICTERKSTKKIFYTEGIPGRKFTRISGRCVNEMEVFLFNSDVK